MGNAQYDYPAIRAWYIQQPERPSARETAERFGIKSHTTLFAKMQRDEWEVDRLKVIAEVRDKSIEILSQTVAAKMARLNDSMIDVVQAAVLKMGIDMEDRWETDPDSGTRVFVQARPVDARAISLLLDRVLKLNGVDDRKGGSAGPSLNIHEHLHLGADSLPTTPQGFGMARQLLERAEREGAGTERMGRSALPRAEDARPVEGAVAVTVG